MNITIRIPTKNGRLKTAASFNILMKEMMEEGLWVGRGDFFEFDKKTYEVKRTLLTGKKYIIDLGYYKSFNYDYPLIVDYTHRI